MVQGAGQGPGQGRPGDLVGYARVSTRDRTVALQLDALHVAKCSRVFEETASGAQRDRPQLAAALDYMRPGDTLVVWKLDRLARSVPDARDIADSLAAPSMIQPTRWASCFSTFLRPLHPSYLDFWTRQFY